MKIGIPKALAYYYFYPFWESFFKNLNIETVVSPTTNKEILDSGVRLAVDEACIPVKLFLGHVAYLMDKADFIFIPGIKSTEPKRYYCPQMIALPETTRTTFSKQVFLTPEINSYNRQFKWKEDYYEFAIKLGYDHSRAWDAVEKSWTMHENVPPRVKQNASADSCLEIAIIGQPYLLNDSFINFDLNKKLIDYGAVIRIPQELSPSQVDANTKILDKDLFWSYPRNMVAAAKHYSQEEIVDGFIFLNSFACGTNAIIEPYILKMTENVPVLTVTLDEHTSPTGMQTRLEAFLDMVIRNKEVKNESGLSLNGAFTYRSGSLL
ncbi:MAG: hypothetical protein APF76_03165 [Desulfitibacter sp. BRH_c19]|nr:MAG: hypothetical protein APF76_03165 [Desulfitibacter sp. BRH_c19]